MAKQADYEVQVTGGLEIKYVLLSWAIAKFLENNHTRHDLQKIKESFFLYGFRDPLAYDKTLNGGTGGIIEGNGRLEDLRQCFNNDPTKIPRNIFAVQGINGDDWAIPMVFGGDATTEEEARRYAIDHNIIPMLGGDFTLNEILSKAFNRSIYDELTEYAGQGDFTISAEPDDLDHAVDLLAALDDQMLDFGDDEEEDVTSSMDYNNKKFPLALALDKETWEDWNSFKDSVGLKNDLICLQKLLAIAND